MNKRVTAALLVILTVGLSCPAALADDPLEPPVDSGYIEEERLAESIPEPGATEETPKEPEPPNALIPDQPPNGLPPEDTPPPVEDGGCDTIEKLAELVALDRGGTITVTGDLILTGGDSIYLNVENPVAVDLGAHGIHIAGDASLELSGPITLTGDGAPNPLLTVSGSLTMQDGASLSAAGENAVAVRLTGGWWHTNQASVEAAGTGVCAVEAEDVERLELYRVHLAARGENSLCVRSTAPVQMILCRAESEGLLVDAPALTLDGTAASPEPEDAQIIRRVPVSHDTLSTNGLWIEAGAGQKKLDALLEDRLYSKIFEFGLSDEARVDEDILYFTAMVWTVDTVDLNLPGVYWLTGEPEDGDLGGVAPFEKRVPLHVADPAKPAVEAAYNLDDGAELHFFRPIQDAERLTLWYSADGGASWQDAGALPEAEISAEGAVLPQLPEANRDYLFCLEVAGGPMAGRSNTLRYLHYDNIWGWGTGGDWDGGDWGDQGALPDDHPAPPPDREPEDDLAVPPPPTQEPDREDDRDSGHGSGTAERPNRPAPPVTPTPAPTPEPQEIEVSFVEPVPIVEPPPDSALAETVPPPESAAPAPSTPVPVSDAPKPAPSAGHTSMADALPKGATASLTGRDLEAQKLANPAGVTLAGNGLKVTLPYTLTNALGLEADGVLAARLDTPDPSSFEVRFWADGKEVADFGGGTFTVTTPYDAPAGTEVYCNNSVGAELPAQSYTEGEAVFTLSAPGLYTVGARTIETAAPVQAPGPSPAAAAQLQEAEAPRTLWPIAAGGAVLTAALAALWLHKRRGGGR